MSDNEEPSGKAVQSAKKAVVKETMKGLGKDGHYYVIAAGIVAESLNRRYGLGLTPQEILGIGGALFIGAIRLRQFLGN